MRSSFMTCITLLVAAVLPFETAAQNKNNHKPHHYKLIDIGTFGGSASFIVPAGEIGSPNPVNSLGITVGGATNSINLGSENNPLVCGGVFGVDQQVNHGFVLRNHHLLDLGTLAGTDNCSVAPSINEKGEIAGSSENGMVDPVLGINEVRGVRWTHMGIKDLRTLGGSHSMAAGINNHGQVVGFALNQTADPFSMVYYQIFQNSNGTQTRAVLWEKDNKIHDLGTLGGNDAWGTFINEEGQVTGFSYTSATVDPGTGLPPTHPFLWDPHGGKNGKMYDVGTLGGTSAGSEILGMQGALNNLGHIVGGSNLSGDATYHPFFWERGRRIKDLGTLGGSCGVANAINDVDEIIGWADVQGPCGHPLRVFQQRLRVDAAGHPAAQTVSHAFLWRPGMKKLRDLGTAAGDTNSYASAINAKHHVVGTSATESKVIYRAFLWENGGPMVDLNTLIPLNSPLYLNEAFAINDQGEIAGIGSPKNCNNFTVCGHGFVLIPIR